LSSALVAQEQTTFETKAALLQREKLPEAIEF
jgi:hypothetical protein